MKLAFNGQAHYTDFSKGYELYKKRSRKECVDALTYNRIIRLYCKSLADRLERDGMVDLPDGIGSIASAIITRKAQYRGKIFVGYGAMDWKKGHRDGKLKTFGMVFLPRRGKNENLRCYGYVANRRLFQRMKEEFNREDLRWQPIEFNDALI